MQQTKKEFLSIQEFANAIGVTTQTIRRWDKSGKLKPDHKTPSGYRMYSRTQIETYFEKQ